MPHRAYHILLGIAGVVAVGALLLVGADLLRHQQHGSRLKRRVVNAGLLLLAALGVSASGCQDERRTRAPEPGRAAPKQPDRNATPQPQPAKKPKPVPQKPAATGADAATMKVGKVGKVGKKTMLEQSPQWQALQAALQKMQQLAEKGGQSTSTERTDAQGKLKEALAGAKALLGNGLISSIEYQLLEAEGQRLHAAVFRHPPKDFNGKCYKRMAFRPARDSLERINRRLPLLRKLAAEKKLSRAVVEKILPVLERDIANLGGKPEGVDAAKASRAAKSASTLAAEIKRRVK